MYKRISLDELMSLQTEFFEHIAQLQKKRGCTYFQELIRMCCEEAPRTYFFERSKPFFRIYQRGDTYRMIDEIEKLDLRLQADEMNRLHNLMKDQGKRRSMSKNQSMMEVLLESFAHGNHQTICGKPYMVYDIETIFGEQIKGQQFEMLYSINSSVNHKNGLEYEYVDTSSVEDYARRILDFDGRIIGYNSLHFDNPVLCQTVGYTNTQLEELQRKSLDPFKLLHVLTGRRMSLGNVAGALIGAGKTLDSWVEWVEYLKKYKATGQEKYLEKVKEYCKNDVEITLWVLLYMLEYKTIQLDGKTIDTWEDSLIKYGCWVAEEPVEAGNSRGRSF